MSDLIAKLADHTAILADNAVFNAVANKLKLEKNPDAAPEFYARVCFPASAQGDLWNVIAERATAAFGGTNNVKHGIKINSAQTKPIVGIDGADIVVRAASQFPPELYDSDGTLLDRENPVHVKIIKAKFFPGARVRAMLSPFHWTHKLSGNGVSLNLAGLMAVDSSGAQRLAIGGVDSAGAFAKHAKPGTGGVPANMTGNPGGADVQSNAVSTPAGNANPFQQNAGAAAQSGNPFA